MAATQLNLVELIEQMPATDRELQAEKAAQQEKPEQPKPPRRPDREGQGSKFTGPDPAAAEKMCEQVLAGGRASVDELIALIRDPGDPEFKNYKAEYLLHCLTLYVGRPGHEKHRNLFVETLARQVGNPKLNKVVRGFLVRELQLVGDKSVTGPLGRLLDDEDLCADAAAALVAIGDGAAEQLRGALPRAQGKCRLILVQNLGVVRDARSVAALQKAASDEDRDTRLAAVWALANIGDARSVSLLLKAADAEPFFERTKAAQACLVLAESLVAAGQKDDAVKIYNHLRSTRTDPKEQYLRELATKALTQLGGKLT